MKGRTRRPDHLLPMEWDALRGKFRAGHAVTKAKREGRLPRLDGDIGCVDWGAPATDYDHRDYNKPLEVEPTCRRCNLRRGPAVPLDGAYEAAELRKTGG